MLGSVCWYCHWGWPKQVRDIYDRYSALVGSDALEFGPAHIVWSDENFCDSSVKGCIEDCECQRYQGRLSDAQIVAVKRSLMDLLTVPESIRLCTPEDYDGEHPENYPPPAELEMVAK